jgi:glutathione peroxidase
MIAVKKMVWGVAAAVLCLAPVAGLSAEDAKVEGPLSYTVKDIDGNDVALSKYAGKVVMIVNVASKCGLTKQYEALEALNDKYKEAGLSILGFPANNFMKQEPGTNEEIKFFCTSTYEVSFDMFSKISVKGDDQAPLYKFLTEEATNGDLAGDIGWNFEKFLIGRDGKVAARFSPKTTPDAPEVIAAIEKALAVEAPKAAV